MKAITANRLSDGVVVYIDDAGEFVERFERAALFDDDAANDALARAQAQDQAIAAAYLIEATRDGPAGKEALRESIRRNGPTIRRDLGKQAEARDERL
jgi:hypothetical protein